MYYGYKLRPDGRILYEIRTDTVVDGPFAGQRLLGRRYYSEHHILGRHGPVVIIFRPYMDIGLYELLVDVPKVIGYQLQFLAFKHFYRHTARLKRWIGWTKP